MSTTSFFPGSICETVPPCLFPTQTAPPSTAMLLGERPTGIVSTTEFVSGSILTTASSRLSATQTAPSPTAIAIAPWPTGIGATTTPVGSTRVTVFSKLSVTQRSPKPTATAVGALPVAMNGSDRFLAGSMRKTCGTEKWPPLTAHTAVLVAAIDAPAGRTAEKAPGLDRRDPRDHVVDLRIDPQDDSVGADRPHRIPRPDEPARDGAGRNRLDHPLRGGIDP